MLKIYPFILETLTMIAPVANEIAKHDLDLARQMRRASSSIALNTAEALSSRDGNSRARFRTALGSARETKACLDVAAAFGYVCALNADCIDRFDRICATLYRLAR